MLRKIITIDQEKCDGCGLCISACHEGAIGMVDGKATLQREDYCDGLGDCLPACPMGAISFEEREAMAYDEAAVKENIVEPLPCGCPGTHTRAMKREDAAQSCGCSGVACKSMPQDNTAQTTAPVVTSQLGQWPVQIKLVPTNAPYFENAGLLVSADCAAYAYGNFHNDFMRNRITLIGCPKLDEGDYTAKLTAILKNNNIKSVTVARMEVPCCGGIEHAVKTALQNSGKMIPWQVVVISADGNIIEE
jgi:ferredoxin